MGRRSGNVVAWVHRSPQGVLGPACSQRNAAMQHKPKRSFGGGSVRAKLLDRQLGEPIGQRLEIRYELRKIVRPLIAALVHVEAAVEFELDRVQARRRISVMLG